MSSVFITEYKSPVGELLLGEFEGTVCLCDWKYRKMRATIDLRIQKKLRSNFEYKSTVLLEELSTQLNQYFNRERKVFDIPFLFIGTEFQQEIWRELNKIPYGNTMSYLQLAQQVNNPEAIRAVASANGANALSIIIPCHRIIGSKGELTGYAGGLTAKKKLLELENFRLFQPSLF